MKLKGFFVFVAVMFVTFSQIMVHSEEVQHDLPVGQPYSEEEAEVLQTRISNGPTRNISSEEPDKTQVLEVNEKILKKEPKQSRKELFYKCQKNREVRWIRLYYMKNGRCRTVYSKEGDAKEMSTAYSYESCESVVNNIKKNLENASYVCEEKVLMGSLELN